MAYSELVKLSKVVFNFNQRHENHRDGIRSSTSSTVRMDSWRYRVVFEFLFSIRGITGHKRRRISGPKTC